MYFLSKLHNNSILTGSVDSYCLVCDSYLRSEDEAFTHTEKPIHKKNMGAATLLEKYKQDNIIKVKKGYYCSFCNMLLSTTAKVGLHINEIKHQENKGALILRRLGDNIIAFDEVLISQEAWHGMVDNTCIICNAEFDKGDVHRRENAHILNLIQSKCEFGEKYIYRKVDEDCFFCLICSSVYSIEAKINHHEDTKHQSSYESGKDSKNKIPPKAKSSPKVVAPKDKNTSNIINAEAAKSATASPKKKVTIIEKTFSTATAVDANTEATVTDAKPEAAESEMSKAVNVKTPEADKEKTVAKPDEIKAVDAKTSEELDAGKATAVAKDKAKTIPQKQSINTTGGLDFIDTASKAIESGLDPRLGGLMDVNTFIIEDEVHEKRCIICDIACIKECEVQDHLYNDLHHQMMLKKYREALDTKVNGTHPLVAKSLPDNVQMYDKKIFLRKTYNPENIAMKGKTPSYNQVSLKLPPASDIQMKIRRQNPVADLSSDEEDEDRSKMIEMVDKLQENNIIINFSTDKAYCKRCSESIKFNCTSLEQHISKHDGAKITKPPNPTITLEAFARENYMEVRPYEAFCKICKIGIRPQMNDMIAHVKYNTHVDNAFNMNGSGPGRTVKSSDYMRILLRVESNTSSDIIVNNEFLLRHLSFHCVTQNEYKSKCELCDIEFIKEEGLAQHINTAEHKEKMGLCDVAASVPDELIRTIGPCMYHCGFCNVVLLPWPAMRAHLLSHSHLNLRRQAQWNLERCNPIMRSTRPVQGEEEGSQVSIRGREYNRSDVVLAQPLPSVRAHPSRQYTALLQQLRNGQSRRN